MRGWTENAGCLVYPPN
ncbi:hypothetical protein, partial [Kingella kingae]